MQVASPSETFGPTDHGDAFSYLGFNQRTGVILSHGRKAVFALAWADQREPHVEIEILHAGVAGKNLWRNQTSLQLARLVLDGLAETGGFAQAHPTVRH